MSNLISHQAITELLAFEGQSCLSIYQPTHRHAPENQQNPIRFRQLVQALATSLRHHSTADASRLLAPFEALGQNDEFWHHTLDGLAVMGGEGLFRVFKLQRPVPELAMVDDSFQSAVFLNRWSSSRITA